jgi:hypothetical protein
MQIELLTHASVLLLDLESGVTDELRHGHDDRFVECLRDCAGESLLGPQMQ